MKELILILILMLHNLSSERSWNKSMHDFRYNEIFRHHKDAELEELTEVWNADRYREFAIVEIVKS